MAKLSKKQKLITERIEPGKNYPIEEAVSIISEFASKKFSESLDVSINLGVDPRKSDQVVRGSTILPAGTGKTVRVAVFAQGENEEKAKAAGADLVGLDEYIKKIEGGWTDFDIIITQPSLMPSLGKLGKILGPRGLMPNPKSGTVTDDLAKAIKEVKGGKIDFKVDKSGIIHSSIGKVSFSPIKIEENASKLIDSILKLKPASTKGIYFKSISISSTMSSSIKIDKSIVNNL